MNHLEADLQEAVESWEARGWPRPRVLVIAGSGLSIDLGSPIVGPLPWSHVVPFPVRGIAGHPLELELLEPVAGRVVLYSRGRIHAYQGYTPAQVVFPVRLAALLGAELVVMTNSSGGLRLDHRAGDLVVIRDHVNLTGQNPLYGEVPAVWGPQFPDLMRAYDPALRALLHQLAGELGVALGEGVYVGLAGPSYETPAEVAMLRTLGGDLVGMSTVLEVITARHMGLRAAALSLVANPAAGNVDEVLDHADVLAQGRKAAGKLAALLESFLRHPELLS